MKPSPCLALLAVAFLGLVRPAAAADVPTDVIQFKHGRLESVFTSGAGGALQMNPLYKVMVSRRVAPGAVELHLRDTDVFYIVDGSATFVTGGTIVDQGPNKTPGGGLSTIEFHGTSITGGTEHHLEKGDSIIIPHGIPHQFTQIDGPFLYFVVKITQQ
jgi:mannose-6-phosphate isomerase-like protein (cupin superfamily)